MEKPALQFQHVVVDADNPPNPHCKAAGDLDGDGFPDLLAASSSGGGLFWYQYPRWTKHQIAEGSFTTDMAVGDVDGDGHLDVVIPGDEGLMWYRNPRATGGDPAAGPWPAVNLGPEGARMHDVELGDLDGDGRLEIATRHQSGFGKGLGNQIHLWKQQAPEQWHHRRFACTHGEGLALGDLDGDGRPDVVIGGRWYQNPGQVLEGEWREHLYMSPERFDQGWTRGDVVVRTGDLDGDGRLDIALSPSEGTGCLSWFAAPADPADPHWRELVIDPHLDHAHGLGLADLDRDGWLDIVVAKMHQATPPQEVRIYLNQGKGEKWLRQVVSDRGCHNIALVDVGSDGWVDIFGANWNALSSTRGALDLWRNLGPG